MNGEMNANEKQNLPSFLSSSSNTEIRQNEINFRQKNENVVQCHFRDDQSGDERHGAWRGALVLTSVRQSESVKCPRVVLVINRTSRVSNCQR